MPPKKVHVRGKGKMPAVASRSGHQIGSTSTTAVEPPVLVKETTTQLEGLTEHRSASPGPSMASQESTQESGSSSASSSDHDISRRRITNSDKKSSKKQPKIRQHANLTAEQEDEMFEWLKSNPVLYSRGMTGYKDVQARNKLWADKAAELGKTLHLIKDIWYKSVRSRVGRLMKKKSGGPQVDVEGLSERDKHLVDKMQFLIPHIHEVKRRPTVSMKQKLTSSLRTADEASVTSDVSSVTTLQSDSRKRSHVIPSFMEEDEEEEALTGTTSKVDTTTEIQRQLLLFLANRKETTLKPRRESFVKFIRTSIEDLEDEVYLDLEFEMYQLIHRQQKRDKQLKRSKVFPSPPPPVPGSSTSSMIQASQKRTDQQWQPMPHQWPQGVYPGVTPWQSQDPSFMAQLQQLPPQCYVQAPQQFSQQHNQLQPVQQTVSSTAGSSAMTVLSQSMSPLVSSSPLNLQSVIESTIGLPSAEPQLSDSCSEAQATPSHNNPQ